MTVIDTPVDTGPPGPPAPPPKPKPAWRRPPTFPVLVLWLVFTVALLIFSWFVPARLMGEAASPTMREIESTFTAFSLAAAPVAAMVWAVMAYSLVSWRHRGAEPPEEIAPPIRGHQPLQWIWLVVSTVLCLFLLVWGLIVIQPPAAESEATTPPLVVDVTGQQWVWSFSYPGHEGLETDTLYLPVNQRVLFRVTSKDVIHSFWIVEMGVKADSNPGAVTTASVTPDTLGTFSIRCAELCGLYHSYMQTTVHVVSQDEFDAFLKTKATRHVEPSPEAPAGESASPQPSDAASQRPSGSPTGADAGNQASNPPNSPSPAVTAASTAP